MARCRGSFGTSDLAITGVMNTSVSRRKFLGTAAATAATLGGSALFPGLARADSRLRPSPAGLDDIEHVVILMQENRSFDEYFGLMSGVIGFDDPDALPGVFKQLDADLEGNPSG